MKPPEVKDTTVSAATDANTHTSIYESVHQHGGKHNAEEGRGKGTALSQSV